MPKKTRVAQFSFRSVYERRCTNKTCVCVRIDGRRNMMLDGYVNGNELRCVYADVYAFVSKTKENKIAFYNPTFATHTTILYMVG